jgi:hypothetical protein
LYAENVARAIDTRRCGFIFEYLSAFASRKPTCIFQDVSDIFNILRALSRSHESYFAYPSYLLLDAFIDSLPKPSVVINEDSDPTICFLTAKTIVVLLTRGDEIRAFDLLNPSNIFTFAARQRTTIQVSSLTFVKTAPFEVTVAVDELSGPGREQLFTENVKLFLAGLKYFATQWSPKLDEHIVKNLANDAFVRTHVFPDAVLAANPHFADIPTFLIAARLSLIQQLNRSVPSLLKCVDLSDPQVLTRALIAVKSVISTSDKLYIFRSGVMKNIDDTPRPNLKFNRSRAELHKAHRSHPEATPLLQQLIDQVQFKAITILKRDSVPWHVELLGEGAADQRGTSSRKCASR